MLLPRLPSPPAEGPVGKETEGPLFTRSLFIGGGVNAITKATVHSS